MYSIEWRRLRIRESDRVGRVPLEHRALADVNGDGLCSRPGTGCHYDGARSRTTALTQAACAASLPLVALLLLLLRNVGLLHGNQLQRLWSRARCIRVQLHQHPAAGSKIGQLNRLSRAQVLLSGSQPFQHRGRGNFYLLRIARIRLHRNRASIDRRDCPYKSTWNLRIECGARRRYSDQEKQPRDRDRKLIPVLAFHQSLRASTFTTLRSNLSLSLFR